MDSKSKFPNRLRVKRSIELVAVELAPGIVQVNSPSSLGTSLKDPSVNVAIYQNEGVRNLNFAKLMEIAFESGEAFSSFYHGESIENARKLDECLDRVTNYSLYSKHGVPYSQRESQEMLETIKYIRRDLQNIFASFPGYEIGNIEFVGAGTPTSREWHQDSYEFVITVVRTYIGKSTQYAFNRRGRRQINPPDGATVAHRGGNRGAWHRAPITGPADSRFAAVMTLTLK